jgi:hypothetical protein
LRAEDLRHPTERARRWFRDLPSGLKLVLVGTVGLVLLVFLSPLVVLICALVLGVSVIALVIRAAQRRSVKNWAIVAVASVVMMFAFGRISDILYGSEDTAKAPAGGGASPSPSPSPSPSSYPSPSSSPLDVGDEVDLTGEVFGGAQNFNYDGLTVLSQVIDWNGMHIMVMVDPMQGGAVYGMPGQRVRVHGVYQGTVRTSDGFSYEAVMADSYEVIGE